VLINVCQLLKRFNTTEKLEYSTGTKLFSAMQGVNNVMFSWIFTNQAF